MSRRRHSSRRSNKMKNNRRANATASREYLFEIITNKGTTSPRLQNTAVKQMWNIGKRHRIGLHPLIKSEICRTCKIHLLPQSKVRIRNGKRIITCCQCGRIKRFVLEVKV
ncbi:MAG: hypothetical protein HOA04_01110 [Euryarchaeota archaeon]|nr:hypothetical protein [Euryarchaeota archaeon]